MSTDIETAFHTSLDRLLRGEATLDACLAEYPEHHARLRDMLVVALDLQALKPLPLDRQAVERGARLIDDELQHLRARLDRQPEPASAWERLTWWFPRFMPVRMAGLAAAFAVALIAYGGVTLAAVNSGPDSALYGYRLTLEELRIGFASDEEKAYLYLDTAEQRLREIESAAETGDAGAVARASTAYQEVVRKGVDVLGAVARDTPPGTERTGEVAADYRRRLAEHGTRFNSLTHAAAEAQRAPITRARSQAQTGLHDVHSGPILAAAPTAAPTATPDPSPSPTAVASVPVPSPSPTPAAVPTPPVSPTPAVPTAAPTATPTAAPTPQVTPEPPAAPTPAPAIDVTGSAVVVTGELLAVTDDELVVAGIPIARGGVAVVDGVPLTARVRAEALVAADGRLTLVGLSVVQPASAGPAPPSEGQPPATPDPSPSPEPTPADGTPPPADQPPPESTPTSTPADGEPTAPPEASPTPDPTPVETTPDAGASPTPDVSPTSTPADGQPTATPDPTPGQTTTPDEGAPTPPPEGSSTPEPTPGDDAPPPTETPPPASEVSPTPSPADGAPSPTPETTPSPEATPTESPAPPSDAQQPTPAPSVTPPAEGEPTPTPEAAPTPDPTPTDAPATPTPTEGEPTEAPEATPSPQPTPAEATPPAEETPPPDASRTPTPDSKPPTEPTPTPTPEAEPLVAPTPPTLQGVLVAIDAFTVRAGGIVFSRPLDTPLVLHGPLAPGDVVVVTFEALRAASSYVLVAREVAPVHPPDGPAVTRWQGFVSEIGADVLTINGVRVQVPPEARAEDVWADLETGALVEIELSDAAAAEPAATALRLLGSGAAQSFSSLAGAPFG